MDKEFNKQAERLIDKMLDESGLSPKPSVDKEAILDEITVMPGVDYIPRKAVLKAMDTYSSSLLKEIEELKEALSNTEKGYEVFRDKSEYWKQRCLAAEELIWIDMTSPNWDNRHKHWQQLKSQEVEGK